MSKADLWLNGGYFMFRREILDEIGPGEDLVPDVLPRLIERDEVLGYRYDGFWAPMDTLRDWQNLEEFVQSGDMPWAVWQKHSGLRGRPPVERQDRGGGRRRVIGLSIGGDEAAGRPRPRRPRGRHRDRRRRPDPRAARGRTDRGADLGRAGGRRREGRRGAASAETLVDGRAPLTVEISVVPGALLPPRAGDQGSIRRARRSASGRTSSSAPASRIDTRTTGPSPSSPGRRSEAASSSSTRSPSTRAISAPEPFVAAVRGDARPQGRAPDGRLPVAARTLLVHAGRRSAAWPGSAASRPAPRAATRKASPAAR